MDRIQPPAARTHRLVPAVAFVVAALALSACGGGSGDANAQSPSAPSNSVPVEVALADLRPIAAAWSGTASLQAVAEAQVVSKASGVLLELLVEEGDSVRAGQVLARLDPDRKGLALSQAQAQLRKLESEYARSGELFGRQLVSADQHERLRAEVEIQRSAVEIARLELSYTSIVAPIDGVIAERLVRAGNLVQVNQSLFRLVDNRVLEAVLNVPERELATMRVDLPVAMQVDAVPGRRFEGRVARVSPVVDAGSGTFRVTAEFESDTLLRPGMFGRVGVVHDQRVDVLTVPREALVEGDGMTSVFTVRDGVAVRTPIELGYVNGSFAEVRGGLEGGERVVTVGKVTLRDGSQVQVLNLDGDEGGQDAVDDEASAPAGDAGEDDGQDVAA